MRVTNALNEWDLIGQEVLWRFESPLQVLNQVEVMCETRGWFFLILTHHSYTLSEMSYKEKENSHLILKLEREKWYWDK